MTVLVVALAACAYPHRPARGGIFDVHHAKAGTTTAQPTVPEDPPQEPLPVIDENDVPATDAATSLEVDCTQQSTIDGPRGLHVLVRWCSGTGQYHIAKELVISSPGGTLRLETPAPTGVPEDGEDDPMYPLIEQIFAAGPDRWVVLGWTSYGEGMQTEHAWLIEDRRGPQIVDSLAWTTSRSHGGFAVETSRTPPLIRIGIPLPETPKHGEFDDREDDDGPPTLHNEGDWGLVHDTQHLSLDEVRRLPFIEQHVMTLRGFYTPPFQEQPSLRHWSGRFVWFSAGAKFTLVRPTRP